MAKVKGRVIAWGWVLPLGLLNGLLLWLLSDDQRSGIQVTNPLTGQATTLLPAVALPLVAVRLNPGSGRT